MILLLAAGRWAGLSSAKRDALRPCLPHKCFTALLQELEETSILDSPPPESQAAQKLASLAVFTELLVGLLFALELGVSGMTKPSKIVAFLSVLAGETVTLSLRARWAAHKLETQTCNRELPEVNAMAYLWFSIRSWAPTAFTA